MAMLYRDTLSAHEWSRPVPQELVFVENERQWLIIDSPGEKCAFLNIYAACASFTNESFIQWNQDLFSLVTTEAILLRDMGYIVLAMGDFNSRCGRLPGLEGNTPDTNRNAPMFLNFIAEVNLVI